MSATDLLPPNATPFERAQSATDGVRILNADTNAIRRERDPLACDLPFLPFLGWERSVHHWSGIEAVDRASVAASFADHLSYGSPPALEQEISLDVDYGVTVQEFWEAGLAWPSFVVAVPLVADMIPPTSAVVMASAIQRKNVRDNPVIRFVARESGPLFFGAFFRVAATIRFEPLDPTPYFAGSAYFGAALRVIFTVRMEPFT